VILEESLPSHIAIFQHCGDVNSDITGDVTG